MTIFKFSEQDILNNVLQTHPVQSFFVYENLVYERQDFPTTTLPTFSFVRKDGSLSSYKSLTDSSFNNDFVYGDQITGSSYYFVSSSLSRSFYSQGQARKEIKALKNTLNYYNKLSPHFSYSSSLGDKDTQALSVIGIPSIYYGSSIKKGTVSLKFYQSGTLIGELKDESGKGELIQVAPEGSVNSGSVAGVCLYKEGFILLTGSWSINDQQESYIGSGADPAWIYFGTGIEGSANSVPYSSFRLDFKGTTRIPSKTMFCRAPSGLLNHSNNPTYVTKGQGKVASSSSTSYQQPKNIRLKNTVKTDYTDPTGSFEKITYISKIHIYDENKNLIGVAKLSKPVKKTLERDLLFKLKLDI